MEKGQFVISLDTELAWGRINDPELPAFLSVIDQTRAATDEILRLFDKYDIPATWATVGRMFMESEHELDTVEDLSYFYDGLNNQKIYENDRLNSDSNSLVYGWDIVQKISNAKTKHEIASHSFNHIDFGKTTSKEVAETDIKDAMEMTRRKLGIEMESWVYPKNSIGYKNSLFEQGIKYYRGEDKFWYGNFPGPIKKLLYQFDTFLGWSPSTVVPLLEANGLVNIPGSSIFRVTHLGIKKNVPYSSIIRKAIKGLKKARNQKEIYHLWFHPFNFGHELEAHCKAFERVLQKAADMREKGEIEISTMADVGNRFLNDK